MVTAQKKYTVDFLTKKQKVNEGEVPQYYVENSHPAIVSREVFDMVQAEMNRRKTMPSRYSGTGIFASRIICGECGGYYGAKVWHSTSKYRRVIYQCNNKFKGDDKCSTPHLDEETIKRMFITAVNKLIYERDEILANLKTLQETLFDKTDIDLECADLQSEMAIVAEMIQKCIDENSRVAQNQNEYCQRYNGLANRFETAKRRFEEVENLRSERNARRDMVEAFIGSLKQQDELVTEFDERLWYGLLDSATAYSETDVRFTFKNGTVL